MTVDDDHYTLESLRRDLRLSVRRTLREFHASLITIESDQDHDQKQALLGRLAAVAGAADAELGLLAEEEQVRRESGTRGRAGGAEAVNPSDRPPGQNPRGRCADIDPSTRLNRRNNGTLRSHWSRP